MWARRNRHAREDRSGRPSHPCLRLTLNRHDAGVQNWTAPTRPSGLAFRPSSSGPQRGDSRRNVRTDKGVPVTNLGDTALARRPWPELISTPEWHNVCTRPHNAILQGPEDVTESLLQLLVPYLGTPAIWKRAPTSLELPTAECGSLVLRNVSALDRLGQAAVSRWLDAGRKHVISTTVHPLFPLIARGLFDEALYYRLNVRLLSVDSTGAPV